MDKNTKLICLHNVKFDTIILPEGDFKFRFLITNTNLQLCRDVNDSDSLFLYPSDSQIVSTLENKYVIFSIPKTQERTIDAKVCVTRNKYKVNKNEIKRALQVIRNNCVIYIDNLNIDTYVSFCEMLKRLYENSCFTS